jgi:hypothetical protein
MSMRPDLLQELLPLLRRDYGLNEAKGEAGWLRKGTCPSCTKKELYAKADSPWVLRCGRQAKCGAEYRVQSLYPDLFEDWSKRAKKAQEPGQPENPNAAADLYLSEGRGFNLMLIKGWYSQESFYEPEADNGRGAGSATVRWPVATTWWQRIIDRPHRFSSKAKFGTGGEYKGHAWVPPSLVLADVHRLWITEGIFNSIALLHHGIASVSAMSAYNYPSEFLKVLRLAHAERGTECVLVFALDADPAGIKSTKEWADKARADGWEVEAAQIPQHGRGDGLDWNDLHQLDRLDEKHLAEYLHHGALLIAKSASEKALLIYRHSGGKRTEFHLDHDNRLYWFKLDLEKLNKAVQALEKEDRLNDEEVRDEAMKQAHTVRQIANCLPKPLYYQANVVTDESWYYFRVTFPHDGKPIKNTFSAGALAAGAEFKKRLLAIAPGAVFSGTSQMLERMMERELYNIHRVETIDFLGYSREHGAYLLGPLAVKGGKVYERNDEDFFELGKLSLKSLSAGLALTINKDLQQYSEAWFPLLWRCYGAKGLLTLTFWLGSLFAEQLRASQKFYPFFELVGEPGAGKSTLIEFLWRLIGRPDYEGFDPSKATPAARGRYFSQVSNLPVVLIEGDRQEGKDKLHAKSFDWEELKPMLGGKGLRARGMATSGNETYEPPFRGAVFISQNARVDGSPAILSRIVHVTVDTSGHTPQTKSMAEALERLPMEQISGFMLKVLQREKEILEFIEQNRLACEKEIFAAQDGAISVRINKIHGQMLALARCLRMVVSITEDQQAALERQIHLCARERQESINADHPTVVKFWETFEFLDQGNAPLNHSRDPDTTIAISLNHFIQTCRDKGQETPSLDELKKLLPASRRHKFITQKTINSRLKAEINTNTSTAIWCWVFERASAKR